MPLRTKKMLTGLAVVLTAALFIASSPAFRESRKEKEMRIIAENRLKRKALKIACDASEIRGRKLVETYRLSSLKKGRRYRISGNAELRKRHSFFSLPFRTQKASAETAAVKTDDQPVLVTLEYRIPDSEWNSKASYGKERSTDLDDTSYGVRKTRSGLVTVEEIRQ